ncbi:MAG: hypothetical protein HYS22_03320 [Deltaproteobacteria bacterium]|nr:hypothetical protein [Deltaproteobacteria bacterium]
MVDCTQPNGFWDHAYCYGDIALSAVLGPAEAIRSRLFREWHAVINPGIVYYSPQFGSTADAFIPDGYNLETAVTRVQAYYPQAHRRFLAQYVIRGAAFATDVLAGFKAMDRLSYGESQTEGTVFQDGLYLAQAFVGMMAVTHPSRLQQAFWGDASLLIGGVTLTSNAGSLRSVWQYEGGWNSETVRQLAPHLTLTAMNFALGGGFQRDRRAFLARDRQNRANLKNPARSGWYMGVRQVPETTVVDYAREELPGIPVSRLPASVKTVKVENTRYGLFDHLDGAEHEVGYIEIHQPISPARERLGRPEITVEMFPRYLDQNRLARARASLLHHQPAVLWNGWSTQTTNPFISSSASYQRSLPPGWRVSAAVLKSEWTHDALTGQPFLANSPIKYVGPDHRYHLDRAKGVVRRGTIFQQYITGPLLNARDSINDYRTLFAYLRETRRVYFGLVSHPQRPTPLSRYTRVMADRPGSRRAIPKPAWWWERWKQYGGDAPPEAGNWQRLPTREFLASQRVRKGT